MWKTEDAGKTWKQNGLVDSRHISRIRIHPKNPELVYAAVMGDLYKSSQTRGVYKSKDGGSNWERVLFANSDAGAVDLQMDPNNPRVLYATTWRIRRTPYSLESGGEGSAIWKSIDGGDNWENISENEGLPKGPFGISGVTVSPANSDRVWVIVEAEDGGVFRSEDAGETWKKTNSSRSLRQRAWYYSRIYADTNDEDIVYVLNVRYHKSKDGGKTFEPFAAPHGDHHDLWIDPENPKRMIIGDDGGAQVTFDGGSNWSTYHNQPTAQFYRVTTDNHFPYRIYGAQQDNSTVRILHRSTNSSTIGERHWEPTAGGESAHIAVKPDNNDIVFGGSYGGFLTMRNHNTGEVRAVNVWPNNPMGHGAKDLAFRFQWNFPIFFSPHNPNKIYAASNHLHVSTDQGQSWKVISPDLTRNDTSKLGPSGGPITKDNTGVEYYATIFAARESPIEEGLIWTGSDDGLIYITRNGGENWENVTPQGMPDLTMINSIEVDPFTNGGAYIAGTRYKLGDYLPYLYKTKDYGKTWVKITNGINKEHFTRVLRVDTQRKGLLYSGTESGMYLSFDDGVSWTSMQLNLPVVPITDLAVKNNNLIASTQGRSFWLIDDLTPLHQLNDEIAGSDFHLYRPMDSYRLGGGVSDNTKTAGKNHPGGVMIHFYIKNSPDDNDEIALEILEENGDLIKKFSSKAEDENEKLKVKQGMNRFVWNMRYPDAEKFEGLILWAASLTGPKAVPGMYKVKLIVKEKSLETEFKILKDPRSTVTIVDIQNQFDYLMDVKSKVNETHSKIKNIRSVRQQIKSTLAKLDSGEAKSKGEEILKMIKEIEETLYQTKNQSKQDPLNYPIRLNNKLGHLLTLMAIGDYPPTEQAIQVKDDLIKAIDEQLQALERIMKNEIAEFNRMVRESGIDAVKLKKEENSEIN